MTEQEIFDKVATHLLTQNEQATEARSKSSSETANQFLGPRCVYRAENGLKCAVGCLIPDEDYTWEMEGQYLATTLQEKKDCPELCAFLDKTGLTQHISLLKGLQQIHDSSLPVFWKNKLVDLAKDFELNSTIVDRFVNRSE